LSRAGGAEPSEERLKVVSELGEETLPDECTKFGLSVGVTDDLEAQRKAVALVGDSAFWRKPGNAKLHPRGSRVKFWLWVHGKYRQYCSSLLKEMEELAAAPEHQRMAKAQPVLVAFNKFTKKISNHSNFEDTQLFKYFEENKSSLVDFGELRKQHQDLRTTEAVREALAGIAEGKSTSDEELVKVADAVRALHKDLHEHLDLEEETLAVPWVSLTDQEYKKLRTYLSWYYAAMY